MGISNSIFGLIAHLINGAAFGWLITDGLKDQLEKLGPDSERVFGSMRDFLFGLRSDVLHWRPMHLLDSTLTIGWQMDLGTRACIWSFATISTWLLVICWVSWHMHKLGNATAQIANGDALSKRRLLRQFQLCLRVLRWCALPIAAVFLLFFLTHRDVSRLLMNTAALCLYGMMLRTLKERIEEIDRDFRSRVEPVI